MTSPTAPLRFVTFLAPSIQPVYEHVAWRVGQRLGVPTEFAVGDTYERFDAASDDVAFVCSLPYVRLADHGASPWQPVAAPVLQGERYGGRPVYFSDVIVHRDSAIRSFPDLRGRSWSYNEPLSHSGCGVVRFHLAGLGETAAFFGRVVESGYHQRSIRMVADGEVDASAVDSQVLGVELRDDPALASRLRVIERLGPSTIQPVCVAGRLPAGLRADISAVLLELGSDPDSREALDLGLVDRFVQIQDKDYDDIRAMDAAADAAGVAQLR